MVAKNVLNRLSCGQITVLRAIWKLRVMMRKFPNWKQLLSLALLLGVFITSGCADDGEPNRRGPAEALGLTVYLGHTSPVETEEYRDSVVWTFDQDDGPMCMRGGAFRASMRNTGHDDLVIFLQGGGACWSEFCLAVTAAPKGVPRVDVLNPGIEGNPVADWNVLYLPYCDGSLFVGDMDHDEDGDGEPDRFHRGLHNLSAALTQGAIEFPEPRRVLLAGASAGGYGTVLAAVLVRHVWPDAELIIMNDSGVGVAKDGDPEFIRGLLEEFNALRFIPDDCVGCLDQGHILPVVEWGLENVPNTRIGVFSSLEDSIISGLFLKIDPEDYSRILLRETGRVHERFPNTYRRFIIPGHMHTTLLGDATGIIGSDLSAVELPPDAMSGLGQLDLGKMVRTEAADGTRFMDWFQALIDGSEEWRDVTP